MCLYDVECDAVFPIVIGFCPQRITHCVGAYNIHPVIAGIAARNVSAIKTLLHRIASLVGTAISIMSHERILRIYTHRRAEENKNKDEFFHSGYDSRKGIQR